MNFTGLPAIMEHHEGFIPSACGHTCRKVDSHEARQALPTDIQDVVLALEGVVLSVEHNGDLPRGR